jgi:enterochelin esterase family protein
MASDLFARAKLEGTPLVDGSGAVFIWRGHEAPRLLGDFNSWEDSADALMEPAGEGLWTKRIELPSDAYVEYIFHLGEERRHDPLNNQKISNGMGKHNNYFYMPAAQPAEEIEQRSAVPAGWLESFELATGGYLGSHKRHVTLYAPPVEQAVPLVVVYDGSDYLRLAHLAVIVDNLIADGKIQPLALAFLDNGKDARMLEYACAESTLSFILMQVLPLAQEKLNLLDIQANPGAYGVIGASMSGLMALFSGLRLPQIFGKVVAQSGAYSLDGYDYVVWDLARQIDPACLRVWMDAGSLEYLAECSQKMARLLKARGVACEYHEYAGGHNYTVWRNDLPQALRYLYGSES